MSTPKTPIAISLNPAKQVWVGHALTVHVSDFGKLPLNVTARTVVLHGRCVMSDTGKVHVTPAAFTLHPGQTITATVTVEPSHADYGVLFQGTAVGAHGDLLAGAVGSQVLSGGAQSCVPVKTHIAALPTSTGGFPLLFVLAGVLALVLLIGGLGWRRFRHV